MSIIIFDGGMHQKDPSDVLVYAFDWSYYEALPVGVEIASFSNVITGPDSLLTKDQESSEDQFTYLRLSGGTLGETYTITCTITTNETIPQTLERSFRVYLEQR